MTEQLSIEQLENNIIETLNNETRKLANAMQLYYDLGLSLIDFDGVEVSSFTWEPKNNKLNCEFELETFSGSAGFKDTFTLLNNDYSLEDVNHQIKILKQFKSVYKNIIIQTNNSHREYLLKLYRDIPRL